jgi:hypothetical protein
MGQMFHRIRAFVVSGPDRRSIGVHGERLLMLDFSFRTVEYSHCAAVGVAVDPGVPSPEAARVPKSGASGRRDRCPSSALSLSVHVYLVATDRFDLSSACAGAILLAKTGLLDGRPPTLHGVHQDLFQKRFPKYASIRNRTWSMPNRKNALSLPERHIQA